MLLHITRTAEGLHVEGEIDMSSVHEFSEAMSEVSRSDGGLVVDLAGVTFMDSTGLRALLKQAASRNGNGPVVLRHPRSPVRRLLEITIPGGVEGLEVQE